MRGDVFQRRRLAPRWGDHRRGVTGDAAEARSTSASSVSARAPARRDAETRDRLGARAHIELRQDRGNMMVDGLGRDVQLAGELSVGVALYQQT